MPKRKSAKELREEREKAIRDELTRFEALAVASERDKEVSGKGINGAIDWAADKLARPSYAIGNALDAILAQAQSKERPGVVNEAMRALLAAPGGALGLPISEAAKLLPKKSEEELDRTTGERNALLAALSGLSGKEKTDVADAWGNVGARSPDSDFNRFLESDIGQIAGEAANVGYDPLSALVGIGAAGKTGKLARLAQSGTKGAELKAAGSTGLKGVARRAMAGVTDTNPYHIAEGLSAAARSKDGGEVTKEDLLNAFVASKIAGAVGGKLSKAFGGGRGVGPSDLVPPPELTDDVIKASYGSSPSRIMGELMPGPGPARPQGPIPMQALPPGPGPSVRGQSYMPDIEGPIPGQRPIMGELMPGSTPTPSMPFDEMAWDQPTIPIEDANAILEQLMNFGPKGRIRKPRQLEIPLNATFDPMEYWNRF